MVLWVFDKSTMGILRYGYERTAQELEYNTY